LIKLGDKWNLSYLNDKTGNIHLGYEFKHLEGKLSDDEFHKFLTDMLMHETLHKVLMEEFNFVTSKFFDAIEHLFGDFNLKRKIFLKLSTAVDVYGEPQTWHEYIEEEGIEVFLERYHVSYQDINQAYIICNSR